MGWFESTNGDDTVFNLDKVIVRNSGLKLRQGLNPKQSENQLPDHFLQLCIQVAREAAKKGIVNSLLDRVAELDRGVHESEGAT